MFRFCAFLCFLALIFTVTACGGEDMTVTARSSAENTMQKVKETDRFIYFCTPDDVKIVDDIDALMADKCPEVNRFLDIEYDGKITVMMYPDQNGYDESIADKDMRGSPAYSKQRSIILVSPDSPIRVVVPREERLMMAVHEYVHIALGSINNDMPMWMNEGLASYLGSTDGYDSFCRYAVPQLKEIHFNTLWDSYYDLLAPDVYSCCAVRLIVERFGYDTMNELIRNPNSFEDILSITKDDFSILWNDYINQNFL